MLFKTAFYIFIKSQFLLNVLVPLKVDCANVGNDMVRGFIYTAKEIMEKLMSQWKIPKLVTGNDGKISFQIDSHSEANSECNMCRHGVDPETIVGNWSLVFVSTNFWLSIISDLDTAINKLERNQPLSDQKTLMELISAPPELRCPQLTVLDSADSTKFQFVYQLGTNPRKKSIVGNFERAADGVYEWNLVPPNLSARVCIAYAGFFQENLSQSTKNSGSSDNINYVSLQHEVKPSYQNYNNYPSDQAMERNEEINLSQKNLSSNVPLEPQDFNNNIINTIVATEENKNVNNRGSDNYADDQMKSEQNNLNKEAQLTTHAINKEDEEFENESVKLNNETKIENVFDISSDFVNKDTNYQPIHEEVTREANSSCNVTISYQKLKRALRFNGAPKLYASLPLNQPLASSLSILPELKPNVYPYSAATSDDQFQSSIQSINANRKNSIIAESQMQSRPSSFNQFSLIEQTQKGLPVTEFLVLNHIDSTPLACNNYLVLMRIPTEISEKEASSQIFRLRDFLERENIETMFNKLERIHCN